MRAQNKKICNTIRDAPTRSLAAFCNAMSQNANLRLRGIDVALALGRMPGIQISRHVLFLLWRHFGGVRLTRNAPGTKQSSRDVVLAQTRLSIVELTTASVT
jgi:hypothetical protein